MEKSMTFMEAYKLYWKNYVKFSGRSRRKEYWVPTLFNFIISFVLSMISAIMATLLIDDINAQAVAENALGGIFSLITLLPSLSVAFRRLQDINIRGWWIFLPTVLTIIGIIATIFTVVSDGSWIFPLLIFAAIAISGIVFFVFSLLDGNAYTNKFGPDPKDREYRRN